VKVTAFHLCQKNSEPNFITHGELGACKNVEGPMAAMDMRCKPEEWRLFTDSSMHSLEVVLLHKGNILPPNRLAYAVQK
jgi:hypothetical protein